MEQTLLQYGAIGVILGYFLWKDRETFKLYSNTMQEIIKALQTIQEEQKNIRFDVENIKEKMGK